METEEGCKDGSDALLYIMINYVKTSNNVDFTKISFDEFKHLLKGNVDIPLLKKRYETITEVSKVVNEKMNGNFYDYIKNISLDIELFDVIVNNFETFKDERTYNGKTI